MINETGTKRKLRRIDELCLPTCQNSKDKLQWRLLLRSYPGTRRPHDPFSAARGIL